MKQIFGKNVVKHISKSEIRRKKAEINNTEQKRTDEMDNFLEKYQIIKVDSKFTSDLYQMIKGN